jgi:hypothetical protein
MRVLFQMSIEDLEKLYLEIEQLRKEAEKEGRYVAHEIEGLYLIVGPNDDPEVVVFDIMEQVAKTKANA